MPENSEQRPADAVPPQPETAGPPAWVFERLEETRLPPELKEQILAELPTPEEMERLFRDMQDKGGLSSEEFLESLGLGEGPQP